MSVPAIDFEAAVKRACAAEQLMLDAKNALSAALEEASCAQRRSVATPSAAVAPAPDHAYQSHPQTHHPHSTAHVPSLHRSYPSVGVWLACCVVVAMTVACIYAVDFSGVGGRASTKVVGMKKGTGHATAPVVTFGLWDSNGVVSTLQLTVVVALAFSIDERHVAVTPLEHSFFGVRVSREGEWLAKEIDERQEHVLDVLNLHAARFSAKLVLTHTATLLPYNASAEP